jgi:penicillin-binding protein 1A
MTNQPQIRMPPEDRAELEGWVAGSNTPQWLVWRARIALMWADGAGIAEIVRTTGKARSTAYRWRRRFLERGIDGLRRDASRPRRKKPLDTVTIERVVHLTVHEKPPAGTHWSSRKLARAVGLSHTSVQRIWAAHGLKPHLKILKLSSDSRFSEKASDIVGLGVNPSDDAVLLCVDEKSQIQALDRTQPVASSRINTGPATATSQNQTSFNDESNWRRCLRAYLLDVDAHINSGLFRCSQMAREAFERLRDFMDRLHVAGWRRWLAVEPLSELATLATGGLLLALVLAVPAFRETADGAWLKKSELAVVFLDRYGNEIGSRGIKHWNAVALADFPDHLIAAVLATEDRRFYEHWGIDISGTFRALVTNTLAGGVSQGGSSITQQLAKNLFLSNERTIERKVKEAFLALWLETRLTKNEILKLYLDRAYMGGGAFGVDAAAQFYFGKSVRDVNLAEAAMLAGLFKAPTKFAPHINLPAARARANVVLDNLVHTGFLTEGQVFGARRNPAVAIDRRDESAPGYYLDFAFDEMKKLVETSGFRNISDRAFVVRTALDLGLQQTAEDTVKTMIRRFGRDYHAKQAAVVVADLDGAVRGMVGGIDYNLNQFNRATNAYRQPGSSFKPYVYATALMNGFTPTSIVVDSPVCIDNWCPKSPGYSGAVTLTQAITRSINGVPVKLSIMLGAAAGPRAGRAKIIETARRMGIKAPLPDTPSLPIGAGAVTLLEHTVAYATFPNQGNAVKPHAILEVRSAAGGTIWRFDRDATKKPTQAIPPQVAADMAMMMNHVVEEGTAKRAMLDGIKAAGKTGTTNSYRDAWFVGYTGNFVCGVWYGNDDYSPLNRMIGGSLPAQTWREIMAYAHQGIELKQIAGVGRNPKTIGPTIDRHDQSHAPIRPAMLTDKGLEALLRVEQLMDEAGRQMSVASPRQQSATPAQERSPARTLQAAPRQDQPSAWLAPRRVGKPSGE